MDGLGSAIEAGGWLMATNSALIEPASARDIASAQVDELAPSSCGMNENADPTVKHVIGPCGRPLTLADLPSPDTKRWVIRRKAEVVTAVRGGLLTLEEACSRYALNSDEILSWQHCIDRFGLAGLRTTKTQLYLRSIARPEPVRLPKGAGVLACVGG
jgi:hypothetical protein